MKYRDVLEQCLASARRGENVEALIAAYPRFADQLRLDLAAASSARRLTEALPPPDPAARAAFSANLAAQRQQRAATRTRPVWQMLKLPVLALAAASAVVVIAAVVLVAGLMPSQTAEAGSIEGVVVENANGSLVVQTEDSLEEIELDDELRVSDDTGATIQLADVEPGQLVTIRGLRRAATVFEARRIELQNAENLRPWCDRVADVCTRVERAIEERVRECVQDGPLCQRIRNRLEELREQNQAAPRLRALQQRCESGVRVDCQELVEFCAANSAVCESIRDWLRSHRLR